MIYISGKFRSRAGGVFVLSIPVFLFCSRSASLSGRARSPSVFSPDAEPALRLSLHYVGKPPRSLSYGLRRLRGLASLSASLRFTPQNTYPYFVTLTPYSSAGTLRLASYRSAPTERHSGLGASSLRCGVSSPCSGENIRSSSRKGKKLGKSEFAPIQRLRFLGKKQYAGRPPKAVAPPHAALAKAFRTRFGLVFVKRNLTTPQKRSGNIAETLFLWRFCGADRVFMTPRPRKSRVKRRTRRLGA